MTPGWQKIVKFDEQGNFAIHTEGVTQWKCSKVDLITHDDLDTLERYLRAQLRAVDVARAHVDLRELQAIRERKGWAPLPLGRQALMEVRP